MLEKKGFPTSKSSQSRRADKAGPLTLNQGGKVIEAFTSEWITIAMGAWGLGGPGRLPRGGALELRSYDALALDISFLIESQHQPWKTCK